MGCIEHLVGDTARYGNTDEMLIRRYSTAPMNQLFEHGRRIMFTRVKNRTRGRVPTTRIDRRTSRVKNWKLARRIADPIRRQNAIEYLSGHTAVPCSRRPNTSRTSWAPTSL